MISQADASQRRHRWAGLPLAVLYKSADDQGTYLAAQIATNIRSFHGSTAGLVTGILVCVYGGLGIVQPSRPMLNKVWGVPRNPCPPPTACAEFNAGRAVQLWPLGLLPPSPTTPNSPPQTSVPTPSYAKTERHKSFENIDVSFGDSPHPDSRNRTPERHPSGR
jgi:hypothetical protein